MIIPDFMIPSLAFSEFQADTLLSWLEICRTKLISLMWRTENFGNPPIEILMDFNQYTHMNRGKAVFEGRKEFQQQIIGDVRGDLNEMPNPGKSSVRCLFAPTRVGKTHTLKTIDRNLKPHITIVVQYNHRSKVLSQEKSGLDVPRYIAIRILYSYFIREPSFDVFFDLLDKHLRRSLLG